MAAGRKTGGRQKGTPNKLTRDIRAAIHGAFDQLGGEAFLVAQARENPVAFMSLLGKAMPAEVKASVGGSLTVKIVRFSDGNTPSA